MSSMEKELVTLSLGILQEIAADIEHIDISPSSDEVSVLVVGDIELISSNLYAGTRGYYKKLVFQINTTYQSQCYDACAILIRKLVELLIIEIYENRGRVNEIVFQGNAQLFGLEQLISTLQKDTHWKLNRNVEYGLEKIKEQGDIRLHIIADTMRKNQILI